MMSDNENNLIADWDTDDVEPSSYDVLPDGVYDFVTTKIESKTSKDEMSDYLSLTFSVDEGEAQGRKIFEMFTFRTRSDDEKKKMSVSIGRRRLAELLHAAGIPGERDFGKLLDRRFRASTKIEKQSGFEDKNRIRAFLDPASGKPVKVGPKDPNAPQAASSQSSPTTTGSRPPFMDRKKGGQ